MSPGRQVSFEPFLPDELEAWLAELGASYVEERIAAGDSRAEAEANLAASLSTVSPSGTVRPEERIGRLVAGGEVVGVLWVGPAGADPRRWWVRDVEVHEPYRGRGYGRQAMQLAERIAREAGAATLGLNVFGHNAVARNLYTSLGYVESAVQMRKDL